MFDKRLRPSVEQKLRPVGANIRKRGVTADHLTLLGLVMAVGAAFAIANGALRLGFLLVILTAVPDVLDGAVAKASGTASPRGSFFDSVADRVSDGLLLGGVAWYLEDHYGGHIAMLPLALLGTSLLISYERAKAESGEKDYAFAGVAVQDLDKDTAKELGIKGKAQGVVVTGVEPDSGADKAGLMPGDVIREINRQPVKSVKEFEKVSSTVKKGDNVLILINRRGNALFLSAKV